MGLFSYFYFLIVHCYKHGNAYAYVGLGRTQEFCWLMTLPALKDCGSNLSYELCNLYLSPFISADLHGKN